MQVVSGLKGWPLGIWAALFAGIGAFVLYRDLRGDGLTQAQLYLALGFFIYPLFYGAGIFVIASLTRLYLGRHDYLKLDQDSVSFGKTVVPLIEVRDVVLRRNLLGIRQLVLVRKVGNPIRLTSYAMSRPIAEIAKVLTEALAHNRERPLSTHIGH